jgi:hypothetical protein
MSLNSQALPSRESSKDVSRDNNTPLYVAYHDRGNEYHPPWRRRQPQGAEPGAELGALCLSGIVEVVRRCRGLCADKGGRGGV